MNSFITIGKTKRMIIFCENRYCKYNKSDFAYNWDHFTDLGWKLFKADMSNGKKASPYNQDIYSLKYSEAYCPKCSNEIISKMENKNVKNI